MDTIDSIDTIETQSWRGSQPLAQLQNTTFRGPVSIVSIVPIDTRHPYFGCFEGYFEQLSRRKIEEWLT